MYHKSFRALMVRKLADPDSPGPMSIQAMVITFALSIVPLATSAAGTGKKYL
jgi:hypothetical protein